jgi:hypothetical protein
MSATWENVVRGDALTDARVGRHFGDAEAPFLSMAPLDKAQFSVTHLRCLAQVGQPRAVRIPAQPAYFVMLYLRDVDHCDIEASGVETPIRRFRTGSICVVDLVRGASIRLHSDLESLAFHLPNDLFHEVGILPRAPKFQPLRCLRGSRDRILFNIGHALLPFFGRRDASINDVLRPIAIAICIHLLDFYQAAPASCGTALSVWQEKAAKEYMTDHLREDMTMAEVAGKVGMSASRFADAFIATVGMAPQQWLDAQRRDWR